MSKTVLVIVAHPDDEALGCAGTLAKHIDNGDNVSIMFMTDGVSARGSIDSDKQQRNKSSHNAIQLLGADKIYQHYFPDNKMDSIALLDVVKVIEEAINIFGQTNRMFK